MRTALIAGASGLVGGELLRQLLAEAEYGRVVAVGRRPLDVTHPKLVRVTADFAALDRVAGELRGDDAFCCLGTTIRAASSRVAFRAVDHAAVLAFGWAAQRGGAQRFYLVSSLGADAQSRVFYSRVKGETEAALRVLGFGTLGIFRPSLLRGTRKEFRPGERIGHGMMAVLDPLLVGRWRKYRAIEATVVACAMLRCALGAPGPGTLVFESNEIAERGR
ncbi:MAG: oxidoreductase [Opitutae bacterium]|nr:oxidoreductase [Opitutae bacterium]